MSFRRKVPNAETAQVWLDAAEQSGLTRVEWCAQAGVDARSLQACRLALARRASRPVGTFGKTLSLCDKFVTTLHRSERQTPHALLRLGRCSRQIATIVF